MLIKKEMGEFFDKLQEEMPPQDIRYANLVFDRMRKAYERNIAQDI